MKFNIEELIEKFKYDPNSVKKNYDGRTDIYLAKASYRYDYFKRILFVVLILIVIAFVLSGNISYFNRVFYKAFGMTPREYRNEMKQKKGVSPC